MQRLLKRIFWLGCLAGTAAAVWLYSYLSNDEFLRHRVETLLQQRCPEADVQLGAARRNGDGTISLLGLRFTQRFAVADVDLDVPEIKVHLTSDRATADVAGVELWRPRVRVATEESEFWKDEAGWLDKIALDLPWLRVHGGTVELVHKSSVQATARANVSVGSNVPAGPAVSPPSGDAADGDRLVLLLRNVDLNVGIQADHALAAGGTARSELFDRAELALRVNSAKKAWAVSVDFQGVRFDHGFYQMIARYLPGAVHQSVATARSSRAGTEGSEQGAVIRPVAARPEPSILPPETNTLAGWAVQGRGRVRLTLHRTAIDQPLRHELAVKMQNASLAGPLLPFPLHGIDALAVYRNGVAQLLEFRGRNGATEISARGRLPLPSVSSKVSPAALLVKAENLQLDERLRSRLPESWQRQWDRYRPGGTVHLEFHVFGNGPYRFSGAVLRCLDASFRFDKFPYRLEHVAGNIEQQGEALHMDLSAPAGGGTVRLTGTILKPGPDATVNLSIDADRVPLDERKLLRALPPEARKLLSTLQARGPAEVHWRVRRDDPLEPYEQSARIVLHGASVRWKGYPIDRLEGTLELADGTWRSTDLRGGNDDGRIGAAGTLGPREKGFPLELTVRGKNVELERELRDTLAPHWRDLWDQMALDGRCDFAATLSGAGGREMQLQQLQIVPRGASFQPVGFAVRFEGLHCRRDGGIRIAPEANEAPPQHRRQATRPPAWNVSFQGLAAHRGPSKWQAGGRLRFEQDGSGRLTLEHLSVDNLAFDEPLLAALPQDLASACRQLNPTSPSLGLREAAAPALVLEWTGAGQAPHRASWNLVLRCESASFHVAGGIHGVSGAVTLGGVYRDGTVECLGELALESCTWRDLQFTNLQGPLSISKTQPGDAPAQVVLGHWHTDGRATQPRRLTSTAPPSEARHLSATLLGGRVIGDVKASLGRSSRYELRAHLSGGRLERYAAQVLPGRKRVRGRLTADWYVKSSHDPDRLDGWGYLEVDDGDLYELPLVFNLLPVAWNILNLKRPESPSVHSGSVALQLLPGTVAVRQMELVSDTVTFRGKGRMKSLSADSPIDLIFSPLVTNNRSRVPLIGNLIDRASKELVALHVHGSLREPEVRARYIPNVDGAIQEIGAIGDTGIRKAVETLRRILGVQP